MTGGIYSLVLSLSRPIEVEIGALGVHELPTGAYAYTGSARGSGGFARVDRHRRVASGDHEVRHWHVDHLTGHPATDLAAVHTARGVDRECAFAGALPDGPVEGFGASDCGCRSHLSHTAESAPLRATLASLYGG